MPPKSCFFIGHREADESLWNDLTQLVEQHISQYHVTEFLVGNYGGFDRLAAKAVIEAKQRHPQIRLTLLLPYHPSERPIPPPAGFDESCYSPGMERTPRRVAILRANRYAVDHADYLIAYAWHPASNARNLVEYAQQREKRGLICVSLLPHIPSQS